MFKKITNNKKLLLMLVITIIFLTGVSIIIIIRKDSKNLEGIEIKDAFEKLNNKESVDGKKYPEVKISNESILKYITSQEVLNILKNKENAVIYFGNPTCIYCRTAIQILMDTAKKTNLDIVYYLNIDEYNPKYNELINALGEEITLNENKNKEISVPLVIFVTDGKIVSYKKGTLFSQKDPYIELDDSQKEGLIEIYKYGINDVVSSKTKNNN